MSTHLETVRVFAVAPFWRYAVGPASRHTAAVPFYRLGSARAFFDEAKRDLPWAGVILYKRQGLRGIKAVEIHEPIGALATMFNRFGRKP